MEKQKLIGVSGVYAIVVKENGEKVVRYVGSGSNLESRKSNHWSRLRKGTHIKQLQELYDKLGEDKFDLFILDTCNKSSLLELERLHKKIHEDTIWNINEIRDTKKKVRRGLEAVKHREMCRELFSGSKNPNANIDETMAGEILWYKQNTDMKHREIAELYEGVSVNIVSRIGRDRWLHVTPIKPMEATKGVEANE
ncbi:GIY-YIG nuclease family protein [Clostridium formicaceticum]|uniref:GIY-YIG catalytic domain protein n=1 Tax=Clostridium formicaceticum TaxID=1497 RepID=A0AAC9RLT2_9CLOT|nr:GIY-YIG nuclease family protein [Clostridium formicaceticum]AOY76903.1 hypothetical protein BJL90_14195 [Clostridium formicaceticum]ARE87383.1 GIY-YIG catalytic domain protein [Clostridium formicaceticum]